MSFGSLAKAISVQELIKEPMSSIPQHYMISSLDPKTPLYPDVSPVLPIFDMRQLMKSDYELENFHSTCKDWGFFQVVNHGVSSSIMEKVKYEIAKFYKLPIEEKMKYKIREGDVEGYGSMVREEGKFDWGDRFYMTLNPISLRKPHLFPELPSSLRNILETYLKELQKLGKEVVRLMGKALKVEEKAMKEVFDEGMESLRMTYYPPCPKPELVVGIPPHSDGSGITILNQLNEVNGLQIKKDGVWIPVTFSPDAFVVNIGDILEILSNGVYTSVEHKVVVDSEKERISLAFFMSPKIEAQIGPMHSLIAPENPPKFTTLSMKKYLHGFFFRKLNGKSNLESLKIVTGDVSN